MLVRRCIAQRLGEYFAQPSHRVVGSVEQTTRAAINFKTLWGEWHWRRICSRLYQEQQGRWLTSVELMRPYYSNVIANFIVTQVEQHTQMQAIKNEKKQRKQQQDDVQVDIVEMGGGRGTNAKLIMSYLHNVYPDIYDKIQSYTLIDASPSLLELQQEIFDQEEDLVDMKNKMKFELQDLIDIAENNNNKNATLSFLSASNNLTIVLGCELLDNLPHDKVRVRSGLLLEQAEIVNTKSGQEEEMFVRLIDPLISNVVRMVPSYARAITWIPTVACGVLQRIKHQRPNSCVMLVDFDWLPSPDLTPAPAQENKNKNKNNNQEEFIGRSSVWASGEPIITDMNGIDHECYLQAPSHCDILFPTDFPKLASFVRQVWNNEDDKNNNKKKMKRKAKRKPTTLSSSSTSSDDNSSSKQQFQVDVMKQSDFLELYGPEQVDATRSWLTGYSPLLHDFGNCSVLTVTQNTQQEQDEGEEGKRNLTATSIEIKPKS